MLKRCWGAITLCCVLVLQCTQATVDYDILYTGYKYIEIIVNEKYFGQSESWTQMTTLSVPEVPKVISLVGEKRGGDGGLIVQIDSKPPVVTDGSWKCTKAEFAAKDWYKPDFDDSAWPQAKVVSNPEWHTFSKFPKLDHKAKWIWNDNATGEIFCRSPKLYLDEKKINHAAEHQDQGMLDGGPMGPQMGPPWLMNRWGQGRTWGRQGRGRGRGKHGRFSARGRGNGRGFRKRGGMFRFVLKRRMAQQRALAKRRAAQGRRRLLQQQMARKRKLRQRQMWRARRRDDQSDSHRRRPGMGQRRPGRRRQPARKGPGGPVGPRGPTGIGGPGMGPSGPGMGPGGPNMRPRGPGMAKGGPRGHRKHGRRFRKPQWGWQRFNPWGF